MFTSIDDSTDVRPINRRRCALRVPSIFNCISHKKCGSIQKKKKKLKNKSSFPQPMTFDLILRETTGKKHHRIPVPRTERSANNLIELIFRDAFDNYSLRRCDAFSLGKTQNK